MTLPDTRASLILRLSDARDVEAWDEFIAIYRPLVCRLARRQGLQHADAEELAQEVLLVVSRAVDRWTPDPKLGRFRDWLFRIARNLTINFLTRRKHRPIGAADSGVAAFLDCRCAPAGEDSALFDLEYRREVFRWASDRVRGDVKPRTWDAFWMSSVDGAPIKEVADRLGMTVGSVYIARSRVMAALRDKAREFETREDGPPSDPGQ